MQPQQRRSDRFLTDFNAQAEHKNLIKDIQISLLSEEVENAIKEAIKTGKMKPYQFLRGASYEQ